VIKVILPYKNQYNSIRNKGKIESYYGKNETSSKVRSE